MNAPISYRDDLRLRARRAATFAPRPEPRPGAVIIDSTGTYDVRDGHTVKREPRTVQFAIETHDPEVMGCPMPAWCAGVLGGFALCVPVLWWVGAF